MKVLLIVLAVLASTAHAGEMVARNIGGDEVHLEDQLCKHAGTLAMMKEESRAEARAAWARVSGKLFAACWLVDREKREVRILYEDGDQGLISTGAFRYRPGV